MKYLEIIISLIFIYLLLSLFSSIVMEFISTLFRMRASTLYETIAKMLGEKLTDDFYKSPIIKMIGDNKTTFWNNTRNDNMPHEINSKTFVDALLQQTKIDSKTLPSDVKDIISNLNDNDVKEYLLYLLNKADGDIKKFKSEIEEWYDMMMTRTIAWYKRKTQYFLIVIGILLAVIFNADSIRIISELSNNDKLRMETVKSATEFIKLNDSLKLNNLSDTIRIKTSSVPDTTKKKTSSVPDKIKQPNSLDSLQVNIVNEYNKAIKQSNNLLGWEERTFPTMYTSKCSFINGLISILGFVLTGFAISLGSTFWFDMLKKVTNIKVLAQQDN